MVRANRRFFDGGNERTHGSGIKSPNFCSAASAAASAHPTASAAPSRFNKVKSIMYGSGFVTQDEQYALVLNIGRVPELLLRGR
jgi:hypothetical protein